MTPKNKASQTCTCITMIGKWVRGREKEIKKRIKNIDKALA